MINNKKKNNKKVVIGLFILFLVLLGTTLFVSFSTLLEEDEIVIKSITPVHDESSTVVVDNENVVFNDKNQVVDYKVVIENTQDYDVKITDIALTTPTEEFLQYTVEDLQKDDVLAANSTRELTISLETMGIKGWGRNFADELTANISFEKIAKQEEKPPTRHPSSGNITDSSDDGDETPENNNTTNEETPKGDETPENGNTANDGELSKDDSKEDEEGKIENPYTSDKGLLVILILATGVTGLAIIIVSKNKFAKYTIFVIALSTSLTLTTGVNAEKVIELPITLNVSFESQNVMSKSTSLEEVCWEDWEYNEETGEEEYREYCGENNISVYFWKYGYRISKIYIENEITEIDEYDYKFDVSEQQNGRVLAYLVENANGSICDSFDGGRGICYTLHIQADGIIYPNSDMSYYFASMLNLEFIDNFNGLDTREVTDMRHLFHATGRERSNFQIDVSNLDTSNVTNMSYMFCNTSYNNPNFTLDLSNFDTSKVTDMSAMFYSTGYSNPNFTLDLSNFDTSKVTNMASMFSSTGYNSENFTLDVSNFDTSNVTNMNSMFYETGYNSTNFTLDVSGFDTSKVTDMSYMFAYTGFNSTKLNTSITIRTPYLVEREDCDDDGYCRTISPISDMFKNVATKEGSQITVNYTSKTSSIVDTMIENSSGCLEDDCYYDEEYDEDICDCMEYFNSNVVKGELVEIITDDIDIGDEIAIADEHFNVISQTDETVTMLAQYILGTDYRQSTTSNGVEFSDDAGWEYTPGPKEIDIQEWSTNPKTYVNAYVEYLKTELGDDSVTGDLITLKELKTLGCTISDDYSFTGGETCYNSPYKSWLINGQDWWTRSASPEYDNFVWSVGSYSGLNFGSYGSIESVRPVITISKDTLKNLG